MNADRDQDPMGGAQGAVSEDDLATELEALRSSPAEAEAHRNELLRAVAEADNARKRAQRDIEAAGRFGAERPAAGGGGGGGSPRSRIARAAGGAAPLPAERAGGAGRPGPRRRGGRGSRCRPAHRGHGGDSEAPGQGFRAG